MKLFKKMKDGGAESTVTGYWLIEWKKAFSVVLVKFEGASREAYHTHAFNCWNILLAGKLIEDRMFDYDTDENSSLTRRRHSFIRRFASWRPFFIGRNDMHKVDSVGTSWVLSIRGPWADTWKEFLPAANRVRTLTHGRIEV